MVDFSRAPAVECTRIMITPGVGASLDPAEIIRLHERHKRGDWGELCDEDKATNDRERIEGDRLLSAYTVRDIKVWIITEGDRSVTTVLLPEEY